MIEVLEILDGGKEAIVSTKDLYRVICHAPDGTFDIGDELVPAYEAIAYANGYGGKSSRAEVITYEEAHRRESEAEASSRQASKRPSLASRAMSRVASLLW